MSTTYNFGTNNNFNNCQIGTNSTMFVAINQQCSNDMWKELEVHLEDKIFNENFSQKESDILHEAKQLVQKREENNFKKFIEQNKSSLIVNMLSTLVSEGLKHLFFKV